MPEPLTGNDKDDFKASNDRRRSPTTLRTLGDIAFVGQWSSSYSYAPLGGLTIACLLPLSGRAFHVDDTLFVMAARQIVRHPLDPYGFSLVWNTSMERMADVTKNPPLACYYGAVVGRIAGWSERAFHIAFLVRNRDCKHPSLQQHSSDPRHCQSNGLRRELGPLVVREPEFIGFGRCLAPYFFFIGLAGF